MRTASRRLIPFIILAVALSLAVVWLLLARPSGQAVGADRRVTPPAAGAVTFERPRPEVRAGREFGLGELMRFDAESAPWLSDLLEEQPADAARPGEGVRTPEQVASAPAERKTGGTR